MTCDPFTYHCETPIILDMQGGGFNLSSLRKGVSFDFNGDGLTNISAWTSLNSDDAWLVLDRNGNGLIDNGTELFGDSTPQPASKKPNGFSALSQYDLVANGGNEDGLIGNQDFVYSSLLLWNDKNHNGISEAEELTLLSTAGVESISLNYKPTSQQDVNGNWFRFKARVIGSKGKNIGRFAYDVWLVSSL